MPFSGPQTRSDWRWLEGTYWYCSADCMPAIQSQRTNCFGWIVDQTVWHVTGYRDGYFWGVAAALLTALGEEPDAGDKSDMTFFASITPEGAVYIVFVQSARFTTVATGRMTTRQGGPSFEMQMSSGPVNKMVLHWAYMLRVEPGDPEWSNLPGAGVSVEEMVGDIEPPEPTTES